MLTAKTSLNMFFSDPLGDVRPESRLQSPAHRHHRHDAVQGAAGAELAGFLNSCCVSGQNSWALIRVLTEFVVKEFE